jgi:hypothetical protein
VGKPQGQIAPVQEGEPSNSRLQVRGGFMIAIGVTVAAGFLLVFIFKF